MILVNIVVRKFLRWLFHRYPSDVQVFSDHQVIMNMIPGDKCEVNWNLELKLDGKYVRIYCDGEYTGVVDSEIGWSSKHVIVVDYGSPPEERDIEEETDEGTPCCLQDGSAEVDTEVKA